MSQIRNLIIDRIKSIIITIDGYKSNVIDEKLVDDIVVANRKAFISIRADKSNIEKYKQLKIKVEKVLENIDDLDSFSVTLTSHEDNPLSKNQSNKSTKKGIDSISNIIAVASGKGGVGKSTTSINLALAIKNLGYNVGILDADIYGPSIPKLVGENKKPKVSDQGKILPIIKFNISIMSIGFLISEDTPMIWRGPMVISAINQMLNDVDWGVLDFLIVDMPPGTGDVQLTMAQKVPMSGAVIISTPQDLALIDAKKGLEMFKKVNVPIIGIIENMSTFICPHCKEETYIFGKEGAEFEAKRQNVDFLGGIPLEVAIRETSDAGEPILSCYPEASVSKSFLSIAQKVVNKSDAKGKSNNPNLIIQ